MPSRMEPPPFRRPGSSACTSHGTAGGEGTGDLPPSPAARSNPYSSAACLLLCRACLSVWRGWATCWRSSAASRAALRLARTWRAPPAWAPRGACTPVQRWVELVGSWELKVVGFGELQCRCRSCTAAQRGVDEGESRCLGGCGVLVCAAWPVRCPVCLTSCTRPAHPALCSRRCAATCSSTQSRSTFARQRRSSARWEGMERGRGWIGGLGAWLPGASALGAGAAVPGGTGAN